MTTGPLLTPLEPQAFGRHLFGERGPGCDDSGFRDFRPVVVERDATRGRDPSAVWSHCPVWRHAALRDFLLEVCAHPRWPASSHPRLLLAFLLAGVVRPRLPAISLVLSLAAMPLVTRPFSRRASVRHHDDARGTRRGVGRQEVATRQCLVSEQLEPYKGLPIGRTRPCCIARVPWCPLKAQRKLAARPVPPIAAHEEDQY